MQNIENASSKLSYMQCILCIHVYTQGSYAIIYIIKFENVQKTNQKLRSIKFFTFEPHPDTEFLIEFCRDKFVFVFNDNKINFDAI